MWIVAFYCCCPRRELFRPEKEISQAPQVVGSFPKIIIGGISHLPVGALNPEINLSIPSDNQQEML